MTHLVARRRLVSDHDRTLDRSAHPPCATTVSTHPTSLRPYPVLTRPRCGPWPNHARLPVTTVRLLVLTPGAPDSPSQHSTTGTTTICQNQTPNRNPKEARHPAFLNQDGRCFGHHSSSRILGHRRRPYERSLPSADPCHGPSRRSDHHVVQAPPPR